MVHPHASLANISSTDKFYLGLILSGNFILFIGIIYCVSRYVGCDRFLIKSIILRIWIYWLWDQLFAWMYRVLRLERIGFGKPRSRVDILLSKQELKDQVTAISTLEREMFYGDLHKKYNGTLDQTWHNRGRGRKNANGNLDYLKRWQALHHSSLSVPGQLQPLKPKVILMQMMTMQNMIL